MLPESRKFEKASNLFFKTLKGTFHKCFKKVRIRTGGPRTLGNESIQERLNIKAELKKFLLNNKCRIAHKKATKKLEKVEESLVEETASKNSQIVKEHLDNLETSEGSFSSLGLWKLKKKLFPLAVDPPMAKRDQAGNIITAPEAIKDLYIDTYKDRLKNRSMKPELMDVYFLKTELWASRNENMKKNKSMPWTREDLEAVLKSLPNNKSMDPNGMINEVFKEGCIGSDLKDALVSLFNGVKFHLLIPMSIALSNITTIYKNKGSRLDLNNDRGIFILTVMKKMLDKLIYAENYSDIDERMSDCNIGARRKRNIKDHLLIIHGVINSVVRGNEECIDIQIYDIEKAFDALWLEDSLNDIFDNIAEENRNDKISLLYESNRTNLVAVKTAVGLTNRVNMPNIVQQGGTWGPLLCSNTIDTIGKKCLERDEHCYLYKNSAKILPLAFVDDLNGISRCGFESVALNTFLTSQIELKKLKFHTADKNGKSKCVKLHIGRKNAFCPTLKVHGTKMPEVSEETYLGDILSCDGKNAKNIRSRISKGIGIISQIMNISDGVSFGPHHFEIAMLLRESMLVNGVTTNAEIWYNLSESDIQEFENLDKLFIRKLLQVPKSTPVEALFLETGAIPMGVIIQARRLNYLHSILRRDHSGMLYSFFTTQWHNPSKGDWTEQVRKDLEEFGIQSNLEHIKSKSKETFKKIVKVKAKEVALKKLILKRDTHSKMANLLYTNIEIQKYLLREDMTTTQKRLVFKHRTRMANYGENYRGGLRQIMCPLCKSHVDDQDLSYTCPVILSEVELLEGSNDVYRDDIKLETVHNITKITEHRTLKMEEG